MKKVRKVLKNSKRIARSFPREKEEKIILLKQLGRQLETRKLLN